MSTVADISVIVPIYNVVPYLYQCINSVVNQSMKNIEIILVNDASTDNSLHICEYFRKNDNRVIIINKKKNEGLVSARKTGIEKAIGRYAMYIDADDWISINYLEEIYNQKITYVQWVVLAAPLTIALIPVVFFTLITVNKVNYRSIDYYYEKTQSIDERQILALSILGVTFVLFLTSGFNGLTLGTSAMIGGILMHTFGVLEWEGGHYCHRWSKKLGYRRSRFSVEVFLFLLDIAYM